MLLLPIKPVFVAACAEPRRRGDACTIAAGRHAS